MNNINLLFILQILLFKSNTIQFNLNDHNNYLNLFNNELSSNKQKKAEISLILNPLLRLLNDTFYEIIKNSKNSDINLSDKCINIFYETFFSSNLSLSKAYLQRFLNFSSINNNEVSYVKECINETFKEFKLNTSYIVTKFYRKNETDYSKEMIYYFPYNSIRGYCLPAGCETKEYINITKELIKTRKEIMPIKNDILDFPTKSFQISKEEDDVPVDEKCISYILLIITIMQILFCFYSEIAFYISYIFLKCFCCLFKKKIKKHSIKKKFIGFKKCYSISDNFNKLNEENNKDEGLLYFKGIRGINVLFYTIGMVFIILLHSPSKMDCSQSIKEVYTNPLYIIIFYSIKYSPIFLLACSGAMLGYKFLNFLDEKIKTQKIEENVEEQKINISLDSSNLLVKQKKEEEDFQFIHIGLFFRFIFYQLDKYIIFIIILIFTKYSLYNLVSLFLKIPTWKYFKIFLTDKISFLDIIKNSLFFFLNITHENNDIEVDKEDAYDPISKIIFDYNWLAFNEIFLFLIGIFIIYLSIKKNYQIIYIIYSFIGFSLLFKLACYLFKINIYEGNNNLYAPYILTYSYFGKIVINPFSNLGIYFIGMYFGILLYIYQKEITAKKADSQGKIFMNRLCLKIILMLKSTKKNSGFIISLLSLFVIFIFLICQQILNVSNNDTILVIFNFIFLFDNEIVIFFTFRSIFYIIVPMNSEFLSFLKSKFWRFLHKIYFSFIITNIPMILFFVYHSNTKILFNFINIIFYSTIINVFTFVIGLFYYLIFEMPLKNIIRTIYIKKDKKNMMKRINEIERTSSSFLLNNSRSFD